jgi:putative transposase
MADGRFLHGAGAVFSLGLHPMWYPHRHRLLVGRVAAGLDELLDKITAEHSWDIEAQDVMPDYVPVFVRVRPTESPAEMERRFKGRTSRVLGAEFQWLVHRRVPWSRSYFAASVG